MNDTIKSLKEIYQKIKAKDIILPAHLIICLYYLFTNISSGRYLIAKELCLSESRTRVLFEVLKGENILDPNSRRGRKGTSLSTNGVKFCKLLFNQIIFFNFSSSINLGALSIGKINSIVAYPLSQISQNFEAIIFRDEAIRFGAQGASIFILTIQNSMSRLSFYEKDLKEVPASNIERKISKAFTQLNKIIESNKIDGIKIKKWLLIAGTVPMNMSTPNHLSFIDEKYFNPFKIARIATLQSLWKCII